MKDQLISIGKGAGIAAIGAILTYISKEMTGMTFIIQGIDLTPIVMMGWSVLANVIRKALGL